MKKILVLLLAGALAGCGKSGNEQGTASAHPVVSGVTVQNVADSAVPDELEVLGTVQAKNGAVMAARIAGTVTAVKVKPGDRVGRGQLLLELEAAEGEAGAAAASAAMEEARQGLEEAKSRRDLAQVTYGRYEKLFQEQAVTRQEFDVRRTELAVAEQAVKRAESRLQRSREESRSASAIASYRRIVAPLPGVVTARPAEVGMTVFPGTPLVTVEEGGSYRLEVNVPESLKGKVALGDAVRIALEGVAGDASGRVIEVAPSVDPANRTFPVKIGLSSAGISSGTYGRAWFVTGKRTAVLVPSSALFERGALTAIWVVGPDHLARMRLVKAGKRSGDMVEVLAGLSSGEQVITAGGEKVTDGAEIQ